MTRYILILLVLMGCARSSETEVTRAEAAYEAGEYTRALALATAAIERHPDAMSAQRILILSHVATGEVDRGLALFDALPNKKQTSALRVEIAHAVIQRSLRHENLFVKSAAVKAIGEMGDRGNLPLLIPALKDPETFVRFFAVESLGQLGGDEAVKLLMAAGSDPDPMVRVAAVKAIDAMQDSDRLLAFFVGDTEATVRMFALAGQARRGKEDALAQLLALARARPDDPGAPAALGESKNRVAVAPLTEMLASTEAPMRMFAAEALGKIAAPESRPHLVAALKDAEATVRAAAATALGKIGDASVASHLAEALKDADPVVRVSAAEGLAAFGQVEMDAYKDALRNEDYGVRHVAVGSLRNVGTGKGEAARRAALDLLTTALNDPAPRVRIAVVRALGALGDAATLPVLMARLADEDLSVRAYAAGNLVRLLNPPRDAPAPSSTRGLPARE